ncbi:MAG: 5-fold beta-flower protein, partial [Bacteroidota bacterium]
MKRILLFTVLLFIGVTTQAQRLMNSSRSTVGYIESGRVMNSSRSTIGYIEDGRIMN